MTSLPALLPDALGLVGVALILGAYAALQLERIDPAAPAYSALNALGAGLVLVSLAFDFNLSAFVIETAWVLISLAGLARSLRRPRAAASDEPA